jgi:hypothetical protein
MKFLIIPIVGVLFFAGLASGSTKAGSGLVVSKAFICYMAGIELIDNGRNLDNAAKEKKYRQLCSLTGLNAASAAKIIEQYKNRPEEWQKVQTSVMELLQAIPLTKPAEATAQAGSEQSQK